MKVELLVFEGCPNVSGARDLLQDCMAALDISQDITEVRVDTPELARLLAFPGSPTLRVNDADVDPPGHVVEGSLTCRTYQVDGRLRGLPDRTKVMTALRAAQECESHGCCIPSTAAPIVPTNASNARTDGGQSRTVWAAMGLGLVASACCWIPLALAGAGIAGGAAGAKVAWMRPWALGGLGLLLASLTGWWAYRRVVATKVADDCCAVVPSFPTLPAVVLALSFVSAWAAPRLLHPADASPGNPEGTTAAGGTLLVLSTPQFDCPACVGSLPKTMGQTPGVASIQMDFEKRETRIALKAGADVNEVLADWNQRLGFSGKVVRHQP